MNFCIRRDSDIHLATGSLVINVSKRLQMYAIHMYIYNRSKSRLLPLLKPMVDHQNHYVDDVQNLLLYNRRDIFCGITTNTYLDMDYHKVFL